ncbi:alpha/beta fold hydrolase [Rhodococcus sp. NM-2]|jgi:pimeloyl-ACP methyl ester carboxylesterase|uniref:alpha/beta fold hydrolase n=1 Tax=Rhodococcus TaxID=1827 RepID=UPI0024771C64|nr:alpha/beta hydrolase [Rhodococcus opacus]MDH6290554.1 pimeloyl-ACP methyl ester carboxylesterase [Rhodococcus opacus]
MKALLALLSLLLAVVVGCSGDDSTPSAGSDTSATKIEVGGGDALQWGDGEYGVVLAHGAVFDAASWEDQASAIANQGATVIAVEDITPESIAATVASLIDNGHPDVALVGGSAGADAILQLASQQPDLPDQLVLLSPNRVVDGLGSEPKLFIASEDEPVAGVSQQLADGSPGADNKVILLPGSAHGQNIFDGENADAAMDAILQRLAN